MTSIQLDRVRALVKALRSGEYQQGFLALNTDNCFCVVGVACDLAAKAGLGKWERGSSPGPANGVMQFTVFNEDYDLLPNMYTMPAAVRDWYGFESSVIPLGAGEPAMALNDFHHVSFNDLADRIEHHYAL